MQELRFVAVSEDGSYAVLAVPGRSGRYILPIDERLRAVAQGQTTRLAQYEIEVESPLRPKEIQARIRAGETAEEIADAAGIPVERVRWFEGPVLAERGYIADQAQSGSVRRAGDSAGPGPRLGDIVTARLSAAGTDPADGQWDSRKRGDGNWQVSLMFPSGGRLHVAEWVFDPRRRHVMPDDDNAARLSLPESELPAEPVPMPGEATVTPIASRLGAVAGMGGGSVGGPAVSRFRPERSVIPDRSLGADRSLVERPAPPSVQAPERTAVPERSAAADRSAAAERPAAPAAPPRPAQQDRPGNPGYAEFPESAPYRAPEPAPEPPAYRAPAPQQPAYREQAPAQEPVPAGAAGQAPPAAPAASSVVTPAKSEDTPVPVPTVAVAPPEIYEIEPAADQAEPARAAATAPAAEPEVAAAAPAPRRDKPAEPAAAEAAPVMATDQQPAATAETVAPAEASAPARPVSAAESAVPDVTEPAATSEPAAPVTPEVPAPAEPAPAEDQTSRARAGAKKNAKARRSSVPSWDEIMLGSSRQRD